MRRKFESRLLKLDIIIMALIWIILVSVLLKFRNSDSEIKQEEYRFNVPNSLFPATSLAIKPKGKRKNRISESFFVKACVKADRRDYSSAEHFINQAIAIAPGEPVYHKTLRVIRARKQNQQLGQSLLLFLERKDFNRAWSFFEEKSKDNYLFFVENRELLIEALQINGFNASAQALIATRKVK